MFSFFNLILLLLLSHCTGDTVAQENDIIDALVKQLLILEERLSTLENEGPIVDGRLQHLEEVVKVKCKAARTCEELHEQGATYSGKYSIDPDGELSGLPPIKAFCDFENGVTEILHDNDNQSIPISHCNEEGCFTKPITYTATDQQISALISLSSSCQQRITFDCFSAPLSYSDVNIGWWTDRHHEKQIYFTGTNYGEHMCSCFEDNSCSGHEVFHTKCNCDHVGADMWLEDSGLITNKTALPITAFVYGPLEYETQEAFISIGRLQCRGKDEVKKPPSSCNDLKKLGEMRTGLYPLLDDAEDYPKLVLCDMDEPGYDGDMMVKSMWMKTSSGPGDTMFSVQHSGQNDIAAGSIITFDITILNVGGCFNLETGAFTASTTGYYQFAFSGLTWPYDITSVQIVINDNFYMYFYDGNNNLPTSISKIWILNLQQGDIVNLKLDHGGFWGIANGYRIEFIGMLL